MMAFPMDSDGTKDYLSHLTTYYVIFLCGKGFDETIDKRGERGGSFAREAGTVF